MRKLFAHLMAVLFVSCGFAFGQDLNDGLVAYYPFNGNANDESGNGNDGVLKGTNPRFSDEAPSGNGLSLSSDSWVQIPHSPAINPKGSRTLSFTFSAEDEGRIFSNRRENGNRNWDMEYLSEEIRMTIFQNFSSGLFFTIPNQGANSFQHIAIVLDTEKGVVECYIDGALVDNVVFGGGLPESSLTGWENYQGLVPLDIGREEGYTDSIIESAVIDELRFYNRALSEEEVTALYNLEKANPAPPLVQLGALFESPTGESITIDATPTAGFPAEFTYQWCFNGFKIPANLGGTASSINIDNLQANEGTWSVTVTNETGSVEQSFEYRVYVDSDSDGLSDAFEELVSLTNINNSDTDNDGLVDGDEVNTYSTNPNSSDSDSDGFTDLYELETAYDPNSAESTPDAQINIMTAIEVDFNAALGATYEIQFSTDSVEWTVIEAGIVGEGNAVERLYSRKDFPTGFFRVERTDQ